jgi:hypothetical protein
MKSAKIGAIFLISVMALAGVSAGYALWFQDLTIDVEINTGSLKVGVRDDGTGDPGPHYLDDGLLYPDGKNPGAVRTLSDLDGTWDLNVEPGDNSEGKNIGSTISTQGDFKFTKVEGELKVDYYHNIEETVYNAYPWYRSYIDVTFANGGTIPAKIADGHWITPITDPDGLFPFLTVEKIELNIYNGGGWYDVTDVIEGFQYQLDPCHKITFRIWFYFIEFIDENQNGVEDPGEPVMPQGATMSFQYFIKWAQWNEVPGIPWQP